MRHTLFNALYTENFFSQHLFSVYFIWHKFLFQKMPHAIVHPALYSAFNFHSCKIVCCSIIVVVVVVEKICPDPNRKGVTSAQRLLPVCITWKKRRVERAESILKREPHINNNRVEIHNKSILYVIHVSTTLIPLPTCSEAKPSTAILPLYGQTRFNFLSYRLCRMKQHDKLNYPYGMRG